jgi:glycosyltransferase involved in cell wall biosynthesis
MSTSLETEELVAQYNSIATVEHSIHEPHIDIGHTDAPEEPSPSRPNRHSYAMFCFEDPNSAVGECVAMLAQAMATCQTPVHIFTRKAFNLSTPGIYMHELGGTSEGDIVSQVQRFMQVSCNAFLREFHAGSQVTLMGFEWSSIPTVSLLRAIRNDNFVLSLHSLERQRTNVIDGVGHYIEETELAGLREARLVLCHNEATANVARRCVPDCAEHIEVMSPMTMIQEFQFHLDAGEVKARFQIGPIDPTILFIGDFNEAYGPDLLMKAMPQILRKHPQARCVFIGDGELLWPLRVNARYLLLDYAVRLAGSLEGQALRELVYASNVVVVPSRKATPWWPIEAAWAASRPVVATSEAASSLISADQNAMVVTADENSIAAGIDRVLTDPVYANNIVSNGRAQLEERYSINKVVAHIEEVMGTAQMQERAAAAAAG